MSAHSIMVPIGMERSSISTSGLSRSAIAHVLEIATHQPSRLRAPRLRGRKIPRGEIPPCSCWRRWRCRDRIAPRGTRPTCRSYPPGMYHAAGYANTIWIGLFRHMPDDGSVFRSDKMHPCRPRALQTLQTPWPFQRRCSAGASQLKPISDDCRLAFGLACADSQCTKCDQRRRVP